MKRSIAESAFSFPNQSEVYHGKVRDVYTIGDKIVVIASDRISAFDHILPRAIPFKGQVLNKIAAHFLEATKSIVPNWVEALPHANVTIGKKCEPIRLEMVIRGYLAGHAWRTYKSGLRELCGVSLPEGLKENDPLPFPIITPATKAEEGHDEDISKEDILLKGIVSEAEWSTLEKYTRALFKKGSEMAAERGLILVDTKYEFGWYQGEIILIDEIHTPDSSRYFHLEGYEERQKQGLAQQHLSKEFVREWLMANNFQGRDGEIMPEMSDEVVEDISNKYIDLYEKITGKSFVGEDLATIEEKVLAYLS
ncbi:MAG: phosphoribosylaminoimidazolesuccinocarboxamide synthase [Chitinophagales bacterium]|nr:phosphoribosylaminoimidazolesuccinocarboxamide synthase [Bacteroidota bacterium]MCB9256580.1 phosphoribosylaminoimidazolesuccinocarboxamide synthase [Chitinophagales bacterium]